MDALLTVEDVADRLQVHPQTVRMWIRRGCLKGVRAGRLLRVSPAALDAFLSPAAPPPVPVVDLRAYRKTAARLAAKHGVRV